MSDGIFIFDGAVRLKRVNRAGAAMEAMHPARFAGTQVLQILSTSEQGETCVVEQALGRFSQRDNRNHSNATSNDRFSSRFNQSLMKTAGQVQLYVLHAIFQSCESSGCRA
jgi:hypothetical protein